MARMSRTTIMADDALLDELREIAAEEGISLGAVIRHGGTVGVCGSCIDARGITDGELAEGARRSSLDELTAWTIEADRVLTF